MVEVIQISNYKFEADSFFEERKNISFNETAADQIFINWSIEAIDKVNDIIPLEYQLAQVKIKLVQEAEIKSQDGKIKLTPISIIESYQEPKTNSIRLGMLEIKNDKKSFQLTVAHEYAHLIFEQASRRNKTTSAESEQITFWPKSIYESVADIIMSMALKSSVTAGTGNWSSRNLFEFKALNDAKNSKDMTVRNATKAFKNMSLIPNFPIYNDWLIKVGNFIKLTGGNDPYSEGSWLAGSLLKAADSESKRKKLIEVLLDKAKKGQSVDDIEFFNKDIVNLIN